MCERGPVGQGVWTVKPDAPKMFTKLGKNWYESKPCLSDWMGLIPGGMGPRSTLVQGPAALASITDSTGLEYGVFCEGSPAKENIRCEPLSCRNNASVKGLGWFSASFASAVRVPKDDACRYGP